LPARWAITTGQAIGASADAADDCGMTTTRTFLVRFLVAVAALVGLALVAVGCGSSTPKATPASTPTTTAAPAADPVDSPYCQTAREWLVHEFDGEGGAFADDPPAFEKYWGEWITFIDTATQQAPAEIRDDWPLAYPNVKAFTPVLEKYDYDIARAQAEGTPAELALGKRLDEEPPPEQQRAIAAVKEYEGRVCQTAQPPAADVSFAGAPKNQAYCDGVEAGDEAVEEQIAAKKWAVDAVRSFVTSDAFRAGLDKAAANAPAEIKADVLADVDWQRNQQVDVLEKYGYDVRRLLLEGSKEDRAIFQRSDPSIAGHYARTIAYEEQVCAL
jgi:hypothetical protein